MAHQLDFKVTLWSDDSDALLELERRLQELELHDKDVGGYNVTQNLHSFASIIRGLAYDAAIAKADVHSIDINWDDAIPLSDKAAQHEHSLTGKGMPQLTEAEFKQMYQGDWSEYDEQEAKRIEKLLEDADKQTDWGKALLDYGEFL